MSEIASDLRRVVSSAGVYAVASLAQKGLAFFLLPVYTRYIDPGQYGVLELLSAFSTIVFAVLMMGLPSAINKCYHRDCRTDGERASVLTTALFADLPVLFLGSVALVSIAPLVSRLLVGSEAEAGLVQLTIAGGALATVAALFLAGLRAQERALAFSVLSLVQFAAAFLLNVVLVVRFEMGVRGVLWGNLVSQLLSLPLALLMVQASSVLRFNRKLASALLRFGLLLVPVMLAGWTMDLADRYLLRLYSDLEEVAIYGVGYKIGMVIQLVVVWPFQLSWPAVSFSISHRPGHEETYARVTTYLAVVLTYACLGLSLLGRVGLPLLVGEAYRGAYRVVPLVALAYALNGIHYALSPAVHVAAKTKYFPPLAFGAALSNLLLNLLLIPRFGMMGAAWATAIAFGFLALGTAMVGQRYHPVPYEYGRLVKIALAGILTFMAGAAVEPAQDAFSYLWHAGWAVAGFPALLWVLRFPSPAERSRIGDWLRRRPTGPPEG
jgi:O-antigen/teichoic acid export membrane protein